MLYFTLSDALSSMTLGQVCYSNCDQLIGQTNAIEWSNSMRLDGQARAITQGMQRIDNIALYIQQIGIGLTVAVVPVDKILHA